MTIDPKLHSELAVANKNYQEICSFFGLTEQDSLNPNAGQWIIDRIKQYKTSATLLEQLAAKTHLVSPNPISPITDQTPGTTAKDETSG